MVLRPSVTIVATTPDQLSEMVGWMMEIDHPDLTLKNTQSSDQSKLIISVAQTDSEPAFEWTSKNEGIEDYLHVLWVYRCRRALLTIENVERSKIRVEKSDLGDITFDNNTITVISSWNQRLAWAKVSSLRVVLEVYDEIIDVLTIHQLPNGCQSLCHGADNMRKVAAELGIDPPEINWDL